MEEKEEKKGMNPVMKEILSWIEVIVAAFAIAFFCNTFIIANSTVPTSSMESTILEGDRVIGMEEKPAEPRSHWCCPPFYFYRRETVRRIGEAIADGCGVDAPGSLVAWVCRKTEVNAFEMPGKRYDVGNLERYEKIRKEYKGYASEEH